MTQIKNIQQWVHKLDIFLQIKQETILVTIQKGRLIKYLLKNIFRCLTYPRLKDFISFEVTSIKIDSFINLFY